MGAVIFLSKFVGVSVVFVGSGGQSYVPRPSQRTGTWFWLQAASLYWATLALYLVVGLPDVLKAGIDAAKDAWGEQSGRIIRVSPPGTTVTAGQVLFSAAILTIISAFVGALVARAVSRERS